MDESLNSISSTLLAGAKARDAKAWERLVDLYSPLIYHWCQRKGLTPEHSRDVGQDVLLAVFRNLENYEHKTFRGWLRTITHSKIHDHWRKTGKEPPPLGGTDNPINGVPAIPSTDVSEWEESKILQRSLLELIRSEFSERDVQIFCRLVIDEKSAAEVAEEFKIKRDRVYSVKSRIMHRIREITRKTGNR